MIAAAVGAVLVFGWFPQTPQAADGVKRLSFLLGNWTSEEKVTPPGGQPFTFTLDGKNEWAAGERFLKIEESFKLPNGSTRHNLILMTYDDADKRYVAWWYTSTSPKPIVFGGSFSEGKFVLLSEPDPKLPVARLRITYAPKTESEIDATLEVETQGKFETRTVAKYRKKSP